MFDLETYKRFSWKIPVLFRSQIRVCTVLLIKGNSYTPISRLKSKKKNRKEIFR